MATTNQAFEMGKESYRPKSNRKIIYALGAIALGLVAVIIVIGVLFAQTGQNLKDLSSALNALKARPAATTTPAGTGPTTAAPGDTTTTAVVPTTNPPPGPTDPMNRESYRLPGDVVPIRYDVELKVHLPIDSTVAATPKDFTTEGSVIVEFVASKTTDVIIIHIWDMIVKQADISLTDSKRNNTKVLKINENKPRHFLFIQVEKAVVAGETYYLKIGFEGKIIRDETDGFYLSSYVTITGTPPVKKTNYLATTQFQPHKARRMFPCFDEPALRAVFKFTIIHNNDHKAYSVRQSLRSVLLPGEENGITWRRTEFEETVRMPSYLLAFLISDFKDKRKDTVEGVNFGVLARADAVDPGEADFSLEAGIDMTDYSGKLFGMSYLESNSKMDMVAAPDFDLFGAMENFGLIVYAEPNMLYKAGISTVANKLRIAEIVAHELAHQWFGNAVTCEWWSNIFLNEGFARLLQVPLVHHFKPKWELGKTFSTNYKQIALTVDATGNSVPLFNPTVTRPDEIMSFFQTSNGIIYDKGATVFRMIGREMGTDNFYTALTTYLRERKNDGGSTTYEMLLRAFTDQMRKVTVPSTLAMDFLEYFGEWITTSGYPLVTVRRAGYKGFIATQERFLSGSGPFDIDVTKRSWSIPLTYIEKTSSDTVDTLKAKQLTIPGTTWFKKTESTLGFGSQDVDWILVNVQSSGLYRVNYDVPNWNALAQQLKDNHEAIHLDSRVQLLQDAFELAKKGSVTYEIAMKLLSYIMKEEELPPWTTATTSLTFLDDRTRGTPANELLTKGALKLFTSQYSTAPTFWKTSDVWVDDDDEKENYQELTRRRALVEGACYYGLPACLEQAKAEFKQWKDAYSDASPIDPNFKERIYCYAIRNGGKDEFEYLLAQYQKDDFRATAAASKGSMIGGMGCTKDKALLQQFLTLGLATPASTGTFLVSAVKFADSHGILYGIVKESWATIPVAAQRTVISTICNRFNTQEKLLDVTQFMDSLGAASPARPHFQAALTAIQNNINWLSTYDKDIREAVQTQVIDGAVAKRETYRLPDDIRPIHYDLSLQVFLPFDSFEERPELNPFTTIGTVKITMECKKVTDVIVLHSWDQVIKSVKVTEIEIHPTSGVATAIREHRILRTDFDTERHYLFVQLGHSLIAHKHYVMEISYTGLIVSETEGLYRSQYPLKTPVGGNRWLATSQFQPHKARRMFPCFDEPALRATFDFKIKHDARHNAYSVRPQKGERIPLPQDFGRSWVETTFERTVEMPTCVLALLLVDDATYGREARPTEEGVDFGVIARTDARDDEADVSDASYSLKVGIEMTDLSGKLFRMSYKESNPKLDMVSVPDFDSGAMENWGLIVYREIYMLYRKGVSSAEDKMQVARVVAHELAHQWFGNTVTCSWWSEIFLNEGFASFLELPLVHTIHPQWQLDKSFIMIFVSRVAFDADALESAVPLYNPKVNTPDEIGNMFGRITYQKGAAVLRMIEGAMGTEYFYESLRSYLRERKNNGGTTTYKVLLKAFTDEMRKVDYKNPLDFELFDEWISTNGFPLVTIGCTATLCTATQKRFLLGKESSPEALHRKWNIPMTHVTKQTLTSDQDAHALQATIPSATAATFFAKNDVQYTFPVPADTEWVLANIQRVGFYRVNYDLRNWNALIGQLKKTDGYKVIHVNSRVQLIEDSFVLARKGSGILPGHYETAIKMVSYVRADPDYAPWSSAMDSLQYIESMIRSTPADSALLSQFIREKIVTAAPATGPYENNFWTSITVWNEDSDPLVAVENYQELSRRLTIVEAACYYRLLACEAEASRLFRTVMDDNVKVDPHFKDKVFCFGMRNAGAGAAAAFDYLVAQYQTQDVHTMKLAILLGLGCSEDPALIRRLLEMTLDKTPAGIRPQDAAYVLNYAIKFAAGHDVTYDFLKEKWADLPAKYGLSGRENIVTNVIGRFNTREKLDDVEEFFKELKEAGPVPEELIFNSAINRIKNNILWMEENKAAVLTALRTELGIANAVAA